MQHVLKTWPSQFEASRRGDKLFEWRRDDRDYEWGDLLVSLEWDPELEKYTNRGDCYEVTYMLRGRFDIPAGYCVMGMRYKGETTAGAHGITKSQIAKGSR